MRGSPVTYLDYSGGRNTQDAPYLLSENQCRDALNVHTSLSGDIEKRNGFVTLSGSTLTGSPVNGTEVHSLFPANATSKSLLGVARTASTDTIFKESTAGVATVLKSGLTANQRWYWAQAGVNAASGPIFGLNGVDTPQKWNGETASTENWVATTGTVPKEAKFLTYFSSRLWCAKGSRVYFTGITESSADPLNWPAENYVDLEPNDGQSITGIGIVGEYLVVFKSRKTYAIYDPVTAANRLISNSVGCVAHRSIVQTPEGLFFLSEDQGICITSGVKITPISEPIFPELEAVASSPTTQALAAGTLEGRRYLLSISLNGVRNDHTLEYDLSKRSWWLHSCASNQFALLDPGGTPVLYSADSTAAARVSKAFVSGVFQDNEVNYESFWTGPWYAWGVGSKGLDPHLVKRIREIRVDGVGTWAGYIASDFEKTFVPMQGETWEAANSTRGTFEEVRAGTFEETRIGTYEEGVEANVDIHYLTPALGRSNSVKYINTDGNAWKIFSTTFALTGRTN